VPRRPPEWEYVPEGWARRESAPIGGWDVPSVVDAYRAKLAAVRDTLAGTAPVAFATSAGVPGAAGTVYDQNAILAFVYALLLAGASRDSVSVLDWGGGVGLLALAAGPLLPPGLRIEYHCRELPLVCAFGRDAVTEVVFHDDDGCLDRRYDLVLASSSLQYAEDWSGLLARLAGAAGRYVFLTRVPLVRKSPSFVVLQRATRRGLGTEYLSWVFNRDALIGRAESLGLELVRELLLGFAPHVYGAPEQDQTRALLFRAPGPGSP
jgi:putative methyltransferase (TIGR04325 family)